MKLIFRNKQGKERVIAESKNVKEIHKEIKKFVDDHHFKSYYTRVYEEDGKLKFDVGSHTELFYLEGMNFKQYCEADRIIK